MTAEVVVTYQARQQFGRLSPQEQAALTHVLNDPAATTRTEPAGDPGKFVSRLGRDMRVYWTRQGDGKIAVLSVVRQAAHDA